MNVKPKKLSLNQETLKILSDLEISSSQEKLFGPHTAVTACSPFSCTLAPC